MDLVILIVLLGIIMFIKKSFKGFVYFVAIIDIILRIIGAIKIELGIYELTTFLNKYVPDSILGMINNYSTDIFNSVLTWLYIGCYVAFIYYLIRSFIKMK